MPTQPPPLVLYNTLTRRAETFEPKSPGKVGVYCCGPTTYDVAHVGHARSAIAFDLLVRVLRHRGLEVTHVRNVTDIDDKILERALQSGEEPTALSARMTTSYQDDMTALGCETPTHEPRVSTFRDPIIAIVKSLVDKGAAYVVPGVDGKGGDVYFRVKAFAGYGKLSQRNVDELRAGARIEVDERKEDPVDFAVWKGCKPDGWGWDSPWGRGRPGWHIECSAMSAELLGHGFDIHGGGMDLIFPHHENEIAQSEAAHPHEGNFARFWVHNGFVNVDKEKMSKSLGNFFTVKDVLARNDPEAVRLFLVGHHYRGPVSWDVETLPDGRVVFPGIDEAERKIDYLYTTIGRIDFEMNTTVAGGTLPKEFGEVRDQIEKARVTAVASLADDLGAAGAVASMYEIAAVLNETMDLTQRKKTDRGLVARVVGEGARALEEIASLLGILHTPRSKYVARTRVRRLSILGLSEAEIDAKVRLRTEARGKKDFATADAIRKDLESKQIELFDGANGTTWKVKI